MVGKNLRAKQGAEAPHPYAHRRAVHLQLVWCSQQCKFDILYEM